MDKFPSFVQLDWDTRGGLYFVGNTGTRVTAADNVGMTTLTDQVARRFAGIELRYTDLRLIASLTLSEPIPERGVV